MEQWLEKIAQEAFHDEMQKIAKSGYMKDPMAKKKRLKLAREAQAKGQSSVAQYNILAAITGKRATSADSAKIVRGYGMKHPPKKAGF